MNKQGFTLIELSIAIVIIGLIIAGVTAGRAIVQEAKIRAQISDFYKFESAFNAFRVQYGTVPGDLSNASSYWPGATDGDGNGRITNDSNYVYDLVNNPEGTGFFEQLSRANLIPESYTHVWTIGQGYPRLKLNSKYGMVAGGNIAGNGQAGNQLTLQEILLQRIASLHLDVAVPTIASSLYNDSYGIASPIVLSAIDRKIDDGIARKGKFQSYQAHSSVVGACLTGINGNYLTNIVTDSCNAEYILAK